VYVFRSPLPVGSVAAEAAASWWAEGQAQHARLGATQPLLGNMTLPQASAGSVLLLAAPSAGSPSAGEMAGTAGLYVCSA
jgi:hypothetical protein